MKRITVKLSELKPNPYKKFIQGGQVDETVVAQIMESAERTSFWEQWVVRETDHGYQLAFGHNRLEAAKKILGEDAKVSVQVEDYSDPQMFIAMSDENAGDEESLENQIDVVRKAKQLLSSNPSWCKWLDHPSRIGMDGNPKTRPQGGGHEHEHGSVDCILAFLGETNWSHTKVGNLYQLAENADEGLLEATVSRKQRRSIKGQIGREGLMALSNLPRQVQKAAAETIQDIDIAIPSSAISDAVEEVRELPPSRQEAGIKRALKRKADGQRAAEIERQRKKENKGKPKAAQRVPKIGELMVRWRIQLSVIHDEMEACFANKEVQFWKDANFKPLEQQIDALERLMEDTREQRPVKKYHRPALSQ